MVNPEFVLAAALASATPVLFAALGELLAERSGVLNLGVEGAMLMGAVSGFAVTNLTGEVWLGVGAAVWVGALLGLLFAFLTITLRTDQVVTGLSFTILGTGLSAFIGQGFIGVPAAQTIPRLGLEGLRSLPVVGRVLFSQDVLVLLGIVLTALVSVYLRRTRPGLILRTLGESPDVLDALGLPVIGLRYLYVTAGSALAGLGGAALSLSFIPSWVQNMTAGRGWIAIALVIFATWRPWWIFGGAILFGVADSLRFRLQSGGTAVIDPHFLGMLPYLLTLAVLALVSRSVMRRRLGVPAALGISYDRERR